MLAAVTVGVSQHLLYCLVPGSYSPRLSLGTFYWPDSLEVWKVAIRLGFGVSLAARMQHAHWMLLPTSPALAPHVSVLWCQDIELCHAPMNQVRVISFALPATENPSCLQTTLASTLSHPSSHTVPHVSFRQISTRPSRSVLPPTSLVLFSVQPAREIKQQRLL